MLRTALGVLVGALLAQVIRLGPPGGAGVVVIVPPTPRVIVTPPALAAPPTIAPPPAPVAPPPAPPAPPAPVPVDDREGLGPCPAPYGRTTDAPITAPAGFDVDGLALSAFDVRLMAAWNDDDVIVSVDEGRTWRPALAHDGAIADAVFDCHGRLHVLRDAELGTLDEAAAEPERWTHLDSLDPTGEDDRRLVPDGGGVAIIGSDIAARDHLILVRRDARGRWRSAPLAHDDEYGSWDGITVEAVEPAGRGRYRILAMPWQGGECGYARYLEIAFDLELRRVRVAQLGEERPARWRSPEREGVELAVHDRAGRTVMVVDQTNADPQLLRIDDDAGSRRGRAVRADP